jgi:hypothetical protein
MDFMDLVAIFVLIVGSERWAQVAMILIGLVLFLFGHWFIGGVVWGITYGCYQIAKG